MPIAMSETAWPTSGADMYPPIQPIAVPTSSAASPTGIPNGSLTSVKKPIRMIAITGRPIQAASHICAAGRMEMNVIEIPASVPSIAARGVNLRMYGPTKAPIITMMPIMKAHARPASHACIGILGVQVDRQHHDEDDDEHVRHARAVRQGGDVGAVLAPGQPAGQEGVVEVAEDQCDARARAIRCRARRRRARRRRRSSGRSASGR